MGKNNKKADGGYNFFLPAALAIILAILVMGLFVIREIKKGPPVFQPGGKEPASLAEEGAKEEKFSLPGGKLPEGGKPRVALIIDDVGWNREIVGEIEKINQPFTLAILPKAQYSREIFDTLKKNLVFDTIIHIPLEPELPAQSFDKGLLRTDMDIGEIRKEFESDIEYYYPHVKGINNHMGSRFTADEEKMRILLEEVKRRNLFFVDSVTSTKSCGYTLAKEMGVKTARRNVFIDNQPDHQYIEKQIWELVENARKEGSAIGIGHARKDTVEVLKKVMPLLTEEVDIVPVSALLE